MMVCKVISKYISTMLSVTNTIVLKKMEFMYGIAVCLVLLTYIILKTKYESQGCLLLCFFLNFASYSESSGFEQFSAIKKCSTLLHIV